MKKLILLLFVLTNIIDAAQMRLTPSTQSKKRVNCSLNNRMWKAIKNDNLKGLEAMFQKDIIPDVNYAQDRKHGYTPLMYAAQGGYVGVTQLLIQNGANVNAQDTGGLTALMYAANRGHTNVAEFLIQHDANVSTQNNQGWTALMIALAEGHIDMVKLLIQRGANINAQNNHGWTALMWASSFYSGLMEFLIAAGADVNARNDEGFTALMHAALLHYEVDSAKFLIEHGADVNAQDNNGRTALMWAAMNRKTYTMVKLLVASGADDTIKDKQGRSALDLASSEDSAAVAQAIEEGKKERAAYFARQKQAQAEITKKFIPELANIVHGYAYGPVTTDLPESESKQQMSCAIQ